MASTAGDAIPDLMELNFSVSTRYSLHFQSIKSSAEGVLHAAFGVPEGTMGRARVKARHNFDNGDFKTEIDLKALP